MGGITSFGQATFMGFGAYATALLTTQAGWSPWLSLPVALLASGLASLVIGAVTLRLSGHYLALGTIAWSVAFFYVFGNLDVLGRNDGISGVPPLRIGSTALLDSRSYFPVVWIAVALALLLTRNLLDSRVGRAIRALRGGAAAAASFGVGLAGCGCSPSPMRPCWPGWRAGSTPTCSAPSARRRSASTRASNTC